MALLSLATARKALWVYGSSVPYATASDSDKAAFDSVLNQVVERFLIEGKWRSTFRRVTLRTFGSTLTLPRNLGVCLGCNPLTAQGQNAFGWPLNIYSRWFEFANGTGLTSSSGLSCSLRGLVAQSDDAQTFNDPTGTFFLRAKAGEVSATGFTFVGGVDSTGAELFSNVTLPLANGVTTTTQAYTGLPFIEKAVTTKPVSIYSVDATTAVETLLCVYAPGETVPAYKRYAVPGAQDGDTFLAFCKLAFVPAVADTDLVIPGVIGALKLGLMSLQYEDKNDAERAALYMGPNYPERTGKMAGAIDILDADRQELDGAETPPFNISADFGAGTIRNVI